MGRSRKSRAGGKRKAPGSRPPAKRGQGAKGASGDPGDGRRPPHGSGPNPADEPDFDPYDESDFDLHDEPGFSPRDGSGFDPSGGSGRGPRDKSGPRRPGQPGPSHPWLWPVVTAVVAALLLVAVFALWPRQAAPAEAEAPLYSIALVAPMGDQPITAATRDGKPVPALETVVSPEGLRLNLEPGRYRIEWGEGHRLAFSVPEDATIVLLEGVSDQLDALLTGSAEQPTGEGAP